MNNWLVFVWFGWQYLVLCSPSESTASMERQETGTSRDCPVCGGCLLLSIPITITIATWLMYHLVVWSWAGDRNFQRLDNFECLLCLPQYPNREPLPHNSKLFKEASLPPYGYRGMAWHLYRDRRGEEIRQMLYTGDIEECFHLKAKTRVVQTLGSLARNHFKAYFANAFCFPFIPFKNSSLVR